MYLIQYFAYSFMQVSLAQRQQTLVSDKPHSKHQLLVWSPVRWMIDFLPADKVRVKYILAPAGRDKSLQAKIKHIWYLFILPPPGLPWYIYGPSVTALGSKYHHTHMLLIKIAQLKVDWPTFKWKLSFSNPKTGSAVATKPLNNQQVYFTWSFLSFHNHEPRDTSY